ncbi:MAG: hypothetical protein ACYCS1_04315 [Gammaproteobacteria bacterium]
MQTSKVEDENTLVSNKKPNLKEKMVTNVKDYPKSLTFKLSLAAAVVIGIIAFIIASQTAQPSPQVLYNFITSNYYTHINNNTGVLILPNLPETFQYNTNSKNFTNVSAGNSSLSLSLATGHMPQGKFIYFYGAKYCPYCAIESYVLYNYIHPNTSFPSYSNSWNVAELNLPSIPESLITSQVTNPALNGYTIVWNEAPLTAQELANNNNAYDSQQMLSWLDNLSVPDRELFTEASSAMNSSSIPQIYVVSTNATSTRACVAYSDLPVIQQYNSNFASLNQNLSTENLPALNAEGLSNGQQVPVPSIMNIEYNILSKCVSTINSG